MNTIYGINIYKLLICYKLSCLQKSLDTFNLQLSNTHSNSTCITSALLLLDNDDVVDDDVDNNNVVIFLVSH